MSLRSNAGGNGRILYNPMADTGGWTMCCHVYHRASDANDGWLLRFDSAGLLRINDKYKLGTLPETTPIAITTWTHLALRWQTTTSPYSMESLVNGVVDQSKTNNAATTFVVFGASAGIATDDHYAYYRVWHAWLTDAEIVTEKNSATVVRTSNIWFSNDGQNLSAADGSGQGNNFTLGGDMTLDAAVNPAFGVDMTDRGTSRGLARGIARGLANARTMVRDVSGLFVPKDRRLVIPVGLDFQGA